MKGFNVLANTALGGEMIRKNFEKDKLDKRAIVLIASESPLMVRYFFKHQGWALKKILGAKITPLILTAISDDVQKKMLPAVEDKDYKLEVF